MTHPFEKIRAVDHDALPAPVCDVLLSPPVLATPVVANGDGFELVDPASIDRPAEQALVPKLAIKSWRDGGALGVIYEGMNMRHLATRLLAHPTPQQRQVARAWTEDDLPLKLRLSPYVDLADVSEARFLVHPRECRRVSLCLRGASRELVLSAPGELAAFARDVGAHLAPRSHLLDIAVLADGSLRLVEVNPGLTPADLTVFDS